MRGSKKLAYVHMCVAFALVLPGSGNGSV